MAGEWIKVRKDLPTDPSVIAVAAQLGESEDSVVGKLVRLWSWADSALADGNARGVTFSWIDRYVGVTGFAQSLASAGWLTETSDGVSIPHFDRHMGQSAKMRALSANRAQKHRDTRNAPVTPDALPEKRREDENTRTPPTPLPGGDAHKEHLTVAEQEVVDAWNALPAIFGGVRRVGARRQYLRQRLADPWWMANWRTALAQIPTTPSLCGKGGGDFDFVASFTWFIRPNSVARILEGECANWGGKGNKATGRVSELNQPGKFEGHIGA